MQAQLRYLFIERPSCLIGWGFVALIHIAMWQVLAHSLDVFRIAPLLEVVQVHFLNEDPPPPPPPSMPKPDLPVTPQLFVPTPEVRVLQESTLILTTTPTPPSAATPETVTVVMPESYVSRLTVVAESNVDWLKKPNILFPLVAKRANEHGTVLLSVIVDERGLIDSVGVYRSSGYERLDNAAIRGMRMARFRPYSKNGVAVPIEVRIPVEF